MSLLFACKGHKATARLPTTSPTSHILNRTGLIWTRLVLLYIVNKNNLRAHLSHSAAIKPRSNQCCVWITEAEVQNTSVFPMQVVSECPGQVCCLCFDNIVLVLRCCANSSYSLEVNWNSVKALFSASGRLTKVCPFSFYYYCCSFETNDQDFFQKPITGFFPSSDDRDIPVLSVDMLVMSESESFVGCYLHSQSGGV